MASLEAVAVAGYTLALRITGDPTHALAAVACASSFAPGTAGGLIRQIRREARSRASRPGRCAVPKPAELKALDSGDWELVERVALRGMSITEAAVDLGVPPDEAMQRLSRGLRSARACLEPTRERGQKTNAGWLDRLGNQSSAVALGDSPGNRKPKPASCPGLAG